MKVVEGNSQINESDGDEMYEHFKIVVDKGQSSIRIDKYLVNLIENSTRNKLQQAAIAGNILVNGKPVKSNYKVKPNDSVSIVLAHPPRDTTIVPQNIPIDIVFEDEDLLVVNKAPGMVVHPGFGNFEGTLVNALAYHFQQLPFFQTDLDKRPGLVHRIDKDTSGLLVIAKNEYSMNHLAKQFFNKTTKRIYNALVWGNIEEEEGTIVGHIGRSLKDRMQMTVFEDGAYGKHAVTHYKVLERFRYITLIECRLETGRTHQIRAHMKYKGHTLFNDERYGGNQILKGTTFTKYKQFVENCFSILPRQALHAKTLGFIHPQTKKEMFFEIELPEDMQQVIQKWRIYINAVQEID
ncbi:RluA family pseudouridine synthase [Apibacter muscae]|uniref:RluA family pseudouridine synthase n=1 Tax=Apibacter muscae TaxID=2509004 RepID=UPI0011ABB1FC|nr:RluA family pseudouridine synthase [Apibacter muscae]TWP27902.1 RluA family pseudouridine synthase [Apibacter muscae]